MEEHQQRKDKNEKTPAPEQSSVLGTVKEEKILAQDDVTNLKIELEKCKKQAEEYLNGWKRAKADYINLKKETETAGIELTKFITVNMLIRFLPTYDLLKKACATAPDGDKWAEGILNIRKQFEEIFKSFGVEEIKTVGEKFNPEMHEAVSRQKKDGVGPDVVIEEVSGGYTMNGKAIIAAKVVVSE